MNASVPPCGIGPCSQCGGTVQVLCMVIVYLVVLVQSIPPCIDQPPINITIGVLLETDGGEFPEFSTSFLNEINAWFPDSYVSLAQQVIQGEDRISTIRTVLDLLSLNTHGLMVAMSCPRTDDVISIMVDLALDPGPLVVSHCQGENGSVTTETYTDRPWRRAQGVFEVLEDVVTWIQAAYSGLSELTVISDHTLARQDVMLLTERICRLEKGTLVAVYLDDISMGSVDGQWTEPKGNMATKHIVDTPKYNSRWTFYILHKALSAGLTSCFHFWIVVDVKVDSVSEVMDWREENIVLVQYTENQHDHCLMPKHHETLQDVYEGGTAKPAAAYSLVSLLPPTDNSSQQVQVVEQAAWRREEGLEVKGQSLFLHPPDDLEGRVFHVGIPGQFPPYISIAQGIDCCSRVFLANETWPMSGFCLDLFREHAQRLNFRVHFYVQSEDMGTSMGSLDVNGSWSGLLGMVIRQELDILVGPITLTPERALHLAFTGPFTPDLIGIMMLKEKPNDVTSTKVFMAFSIQVWSAIFGSVAVVGCLFYFIYRAEDFIKNIIRNRKLKKLSSAHQTEDAGNVRIDIDHVMSASDSSLSANVGNQSEKAVLKNDNAKQPLTWLDIVQKDVKSADGNRTPASPVVPPQTGSDSKKHDGPDVGENDVSREWTCLQNHSLKLFHSIWGLLGLYLEQGGDQYPSSMSGRLAVATWWLFTIIISATYMANLTAHLSVHDARPLISAIDDLADPTIRIQPLILGDTNLRDLFEDAPADTVFGRVWRRLERMEDELPKNLDAAISMLYGGGYALLQEQDMLKYRASQECHTFVLAEQGFHPTMLGFAMNKQSPYTTIFDIVGTKLQESGIVDKYKQQWWPANLGCEDTGSTFTDANRLGMSQMAGAFIIIINTLLLSLLMLSCEIAWNHLLRLEQRKNRKAWKMTELNGDERRWNQIL